MIITKLSFYSYLMGIELVINPEKNMTNDFPKSRVKEYRLYRIYDKLLDKLAPFIRIIHVTTKKFASITIKTAKIKTELASSTRITQPTITNLFNTAANLG